MKIPRIVCALILALAPFSPAFGQAVTGTSLSITGGGTSNLSGPLNVVGSIDSDNNQFTFGTQTGSYGAALLYTDSTTDTLKFLVNRNPASWLWVHNTNVPAMRLDSAHQLILYNAAGTTAGVTLTPASNQLSLGSATLTGSGANLATGGALTVASGITNTNGTLTGGASGLNLSSGTSGTNLSLTAAGAGDIVFTTNGTERARIKSTGNVGIGTSSPAVSLDVVGGVRSSQVSGYYMQIAAYDSSGFGYQLMQANDTAHAGRDILFNNWGANAGGWTFANTSANAGVVRITPAGNVGIGTTNPTHRLEVVGPAANGSGNEGLWVDNNGVQFATRRDSGGGGDLQFGTPNNHNLMLMTNGTTKMYLSAGGNVGIGTANPLSKFQIEGGSQIIRNNAAGNRLVWQRTDDTQVTGLGSDGYSDLTLITNNSEKVRITSAGNVGVGTMNPSEKFEVAGGIKTSGATAGMSRLVLQSTAAGGQQYEWYNDYTGAGGGVLGLYNRTSNNNPIAFTAGGNVGIGTATPNSFGAGATVAEVHGTTAYGALLTSTNNVTGELFASEAGEVYVGSRSNHPLQLATGNVARMTILPSGNVGIGTQSPSGKLDVVGEVNVTGNVTTRGGPTSYYGFGETSYGALPANDGDLSRPNMAAYNGIYRINHHTGLSFSAHSAYGGIRFYNQGYADGNPNPYAATGSALAMSIINGNVGIGTTAPDKSLHISSDSPSVPALKIGSGTDAQGWYTFMGNDTAGATTSYIGNAYNNDAAAFQIRTKGTAAANARVTVLGSGNVGIGTPTPATRLDAVGGFAHFGVNSQALPPSDNTNGGLAIGWNGSGGGAEVNFYNVFDAWGGTQTKSFVFSQKTGPNTAVTYMTIAGNNGNVGIGTTTPTHKLSVNGTIRAREIIVDNTNWADYVFDSNYRLAPLSEVESHIKAEKHLPGIPSAQEIAEHGVSMGDMQSKLLSKIEELTLHMIQMEKENNALRQRVQKLETTAANP